MIKGKASLRGGEADDEIHIQAPLLDCFAALAMTSIYCFGAAAAGAEPAVHAL
jgi:hypothetical protein